MKPKGLMHCKLKSFNELEIQIKNKYFFPNVRLAFHRDHCLMPNVCHEKHCHYTGLA